MSKLRSAMLKLKDEWSCEEILDSLATIYREKGCLDVAQVLDDASSDISEIDEELEEEEEEEEEGE